MTCQFVRRTPQPDHVQARGGSGASPVSPLPARAAPSHDEGPRPWRVRPLDHQRHEIVDANGVRLNVTGDYTTLDYIANVVNEAGL